MILTQRDYVTSEGVELRALADLNEAKANFERAVGRTLEVNRVTIASAGTKPCLSEFEQETLILARFTAKSSAPTKSSATQRRQPTNNLL